MGRNTHKKRHKKSTKRTRHTDSRSHDKVIVNKCAIVFFKWINNEWTPHEAIWCVGLYCDYDMLISMMSVSRWYRQVIYRFIDDRIKMTRCYHMTSMDRLLYLAQLVPTAHAVEKVTRSMNRSNDIRNVVESLRYDANSIIYIKKLHNFNASMLLYIGAYICTYTDIDTTTLYWLQYIIYLLYCSSLSICINDMLLTISKNGLNTIDDNVLYYVAITRGESHIVQRILSSMNDEQHNTIRSNIIACSFGLFNSASLYNTLLHSDICLNYRRNADYAGFESIYACDTMYPDVWKLHLDRCTSIDDIVQFYVNIYDLIPPILTTPLAKFLDELYNTFCCISEREYKLSIPSDMETYQRMLILLRQSLCVISYDETVV